MNPIKSYQDLLVWQRAMALAVKAYEITNQFPKTELYGLTSQMRRSSVAIPSNIAEGFGRGSRKDYLRFLFIAQGSLKELETQALLAEQLRLVTAERNSELLHASKTLGKMLASLIRALKSGPIQK